MPADTLTSIECGRDAKSHFSFAAGFRNLNHGSFGTYPSVVREVLRHYQDEAEARPDAFIRYDYPKLLDESRQLIANYLHAAVEACVFVSNATTGVNTVLRNLVFQPGDVIVYFDTIYGACHKTIDYITETTPAESHKIQYTYPISDDDLCARFERGIEAVKASGRTPRLALFDTIVSLPGVRMPFERLTKLSKHHGVLSLIDGAHGVGHIPLNLGELDPDFFVSNCHKWLLVPRGCAVFYVPVRNQHLMRSTLPTSHGFEPLPKEGQTINNPLPPSDKSAFVNNFTFVGTLDNAPFLCISAALEFRKRLQWGQKKGEEAIFAYNQHLAREAGRVVAKSLGTEVLENEEGTLGNCDFANVRLPLSFTTDAESRHDLANTIGQWVAQKLVEDYNTFIAIIFYAGAWWVRLSSQVYLTLEDFEWAGSVLKEVCQRVQKGEWRRPLSKL